MVAEANDQKFFVTSNLFQVFIGECETLMINKVTDVLPMSSRVSTNHCTIKKKKAGVGFQARSFFTRGKGS